jgi:deoxyadenosine/deoxycytidine kinase
MALSWNHIQKLLNEKRKQYRVIVVDGLIGAGKSTLLNDLEKTLKSVANINVKCVKEPSDIWELVGALAQFYSDTSRFGVEFQVLVTATRIESYLDAVSIKESFPDIFILERSLFTDRGMFMEIQRSQMSTVSMLTYEMWWEAAYKSIPFDFALAEFIYLRPSMSAVMSRVKERARKSEQLQENKTEKTGTGGVSQDYQELLLKAHDAFLLGKDDEKLFPLMPKFPGDRSKQVTVIDQDIADLDFRDKGAGQAKMLAKIVSVIQNRWPELFISNL